MLHPVGIGNAKVCKLAGLKNECKKIVGLRKLINLVN